MIFWQAGGAVAIARYVFKDPKMDLRFVIFGSLVPNLIDKPIGSMFFVDRFDASRLFGHTLVVPVLVLTLVMVMTRRGTAHRKALLGVPIGWFLHVFLDGRWASPEGFWWPFLGWDFPASSSPGLGALLADRLTDPFTLVAEAVGLAYLAYVFRRAGLADRERRRAFLRTGMVPLPLPGPR